MDSEIFVYGKTYYHLFNDLYDNICFEFYIRKFTLPLKIKISNYIIDFYIVFLYTIFIIDIRKDYMFNEKSIRSVESKVLSKAFVNIDEKYNLVNIPGTILKNFGIEVSNSLPLDVIGDNKKYPKVVLMVIDALGYNFFEKYYTKSFFLNEIVQDGRVSKLTTQFPSTTTCNITTLNTGLPVSDTGIYEWYYYEKKLDAVFNPLRFMKAKEKEVLDYDASLLLPNTNLYTQIPVPSYVFQYELFNKSPYSKWIYRGSNVISFTSLKEGLTNLKTVLEKEDAVYCYFYHGDFDEASHHYGPDAKETEKCLLDILNDLDQFFVDIKTLELKDTLFMITSDHGQTRVINENTIYINLEFPEILPFLKKNARGEYIAPCGSSRDMFLHVNPMDKDKAFHFLKENLHNKAEVYKIEELIEKGVFGKNEFSQPFYDRIGDIVILPYRNYQVWWYEKDYFYVKHQGMHGGLSKEEMEIPFLVYKV